MKVVDSSIYSQVIKNESLKIGHLYFLKNVLISEFNEGEHIDLNSISKYFDLVQKFYGKTKPFGYISNRVNKFSVAPLDYGKYKDLIKNFSMHCAVTYNHFGKQNAEYEKKFSKTPHYNFTNIESAVKHINTFIKNKDYTIN